MNAQKMNAQIAERLARRGINATPEQAGKLRRAEMALQRWGERECGVSVYKGSGCIERDEKTGAPYWHVSYHDGSPSTRTPIPDKEVSTLRAVGKLCAELGCYFYHQPDCRGCALYVSPTPIDGQNYTSGIPCCI